MSGSRALAVSVCLHAAAATLLARCLGDGGGGPGGNPGRAPRDGIEGIELIEVAARREAGGRDDSAAVPLEVEVLAGETGGASSGAVRTGGAVGGAAGTAGAPTRGRLERAHARGPESAGAALAASAGAGADVGAGAATDESGLAPGAGDPGVAPGVAEPGRPGALGMRGLRHDLSLSGEALSRIAGDRPAPAPIVPTGLIQPNGREGRIEDPTATYRVHPDGSVDIRDKPDITIGLEIPLTPDDIRRAARAFAKDFAAWQKDPYRDTRVGRPQDLPPHLRALPDQCQTYGDWWCDAPRPGRPTLNDRRQGGGMQPLFGGRLDLTSYLHRKLIGDPYASRKLKVLDATRAERVERGTAYRATQLGRSAEQMAAHLESLWRTTPDPAARRRALFELWDECIEDASAPGAAGERARAMVIGWIRAHLPAGSEGAYSPEEIAALDAARSSRQRFAPY